MGKTKTAFVSDSSVGAKPSGKEAYEVRRAKKEAQKSSQEKVHLSGLKGGQRVKIVDAAPTEQITQEQEPTKAALGGAKRLRQRSEKYKTAKAKVDSVKTYSLPDAVKLIKDTSYSHFDGTLELHLVIRKDKFAASVDLPYSAGKQKKVAVANDEVIKKLATGKVDFDVLLATAQWMPKLVPFAKLLGPRGLMPNPKNGTLIKSEAEAKKFSGNKFMLKTEKGAPLIHTTFGKVSQKDSELVANADTILEAVDRKQIVRAYAKATMSPSVRIAI